MARSTDFAKWEYAPGMGSNAQVGTPLLKPNNTADLAIAPEKWSNVHAAMLRKLSPFISDDPDVNTSDLDLCEFEGQTVMYYCAGQQHYDNVLVVATSDVGLDAFLQSFF